MPGPGVDRSSGRIDSYVSCVGCFRERIHQENRASRAFALSKEEAFQRSGLLPPVEPVEELARSKRIEARSELKDKMRSLVKEIDEERRARVKLQRELQNLTMRRAGSSMGVSHQEQRHRYIHN